jgi:hypothetical protein
VKKSTYQLLHSSSVTKYEHDIVESWTQGKPSESNQDSS